MTQDEKSWKNVAVFVAPFVLYMLPAMFESGDPSNLEYEIVYTSKTLLVAAVLWASRRYYPKFSTSGFGLGVIGGAVGCVLWVALTKLQAEIPAMQALSDTGLLGSRVAYDPFSAEGTAVTRWSFLVVRLAGLALIVPLMEELFWRGFLARYLISDHFQTVPHGTFTRASFLIVTLAFTAAHPELLAAFAWGAAINVLYWRTKNLWACIVMHATTNGLLGGYILATGSWSLW